MALIGTDSLRSREIKNLLEIKSSPSEVVEFYDPDIKEAFGKLTEFRGEARVIHNLDPALLDGLDVVFLAADSESNQKVVEKAASLNITAVLFDDAADGEGGPSPVVAGINDEAVLADRPSVVSSPHPASVMMSHFLHTVMKGVNLEEIIVTVLQPASAFLDTGIEELADQSTAFLAGTSPSKSKFKVPIAFNLVSQFESVRKEGTSASERRIHKEIRRILGREDLPLALSMVQVPVFHTYGMMIFLRTAEDRTLSELSPLFDKSPYFKRYDPNPDCPVSPLAVAGEDEIFVGQMKKDPGVDHGFWFWLVGDNLTRGSALNAYDIARKVISIRQSE